jgi:RNA polymerase sigma factor (sigma-70 family)
LCPGAIDWNMLAAVHEKRGAGLSVDAAADDVRSLAVVDLERVYRQQRPGLLRVAGRLVGAAEAETVIQEVFVELLRNAGLRARFVGGSLSAWLKEIARRKALEHLRRHGREIPAETEERATAVHPEPHLLARQLVERFMAAHVPEPQRRFFYLRFLEHRTQVESAAALGLPRSTVEGWEHKLAIALRRFILEAG